MFENFKKKMARKFAYTKEVEAENKKLTRLLAEMHTEYMLMKESKESAESVIKTILEKPTMIFADKLEGRYIIVSQNDIEEHKRMGLEFHQMFPQNAIRIRVRKEIV